MLVEVKRFGRDERVAVTSLDVADTFGKEHKHVLRDIRELRCSEEFRRSNFGPISYTDAMNRKQRACVMTRDGFTILVMGYTGESAMRFKEAYIRQFNAMEAALQGKTIERQKGIAVRRALAEAIQRSEENARMHGLAYAAYTNCIYKALFGMNANQMREKFGIEKTDSLRDCFTKEELRAVQSMEYLVSGLVECGWGYESVKAFVEQNNARRQLAP